MKEFRLLVVEDNDEDLSVFRDTVDRYKSEKKIDIEFVECKSVDVAFEQLDNSFDGAIIDLRLSHDGNEGIQVVKRIEESYFRIPVAILTGTPDVANSDFTYIGVFKKGDSGAGYADILDHLWGIHKTGLTRIMGGRGIIEEQLNKVFRKNLLPQIDIWIEYGKTDTSRTEKALLRHALNHLLQLIDNDEDRSYPEEMYLYPHLSDTIRTGSIIEAMKGGLFAVLNPACDLVIRGEKGFKTDRILLVEIENAEDVIRQVLSGITNRDAKEKKLKAAYGNNHTEYYHWLPNTAFFNGGFLNFRKLLTTTKDEFEINFQTPYIQISPAFVKDVVARFSSYYARQGQPDIDLSKFLML